MNCIKISVISPAMQEVNRRIYIFHTMSIINLQAHTIEH